MLFNIEKKQIKNTTHCLECKHYDKQYNKCSGIGKVCFEYDDKTQTILDPITQMPLKVERGN